MLDLKAAEGLAAAEALDCAKRSWDASRTWSRARRPAAMAAQPQAHPVRTDEVSPRRGSKVSSRSQGLPINIPKTSIPPTRRRVRGGRFEGTITDTAGVGAAVSAEFRRRSSGCRSLSSNRSGFLSSELTDQCEEGGVTQSGQCIDQQDVAGDQDDETANQPFARLPRCAFRYISNQ